MEMAEEKAAGNLGGGRFTDPMTKKGAKCATLLKNLRGREGGGGKKGRKKRFLED